MSQVAELARGRWPGLLAEFGVPSKYLRNRHGPCIKCQGKDRARFDNKHGSGSFICSKCGFYSGIDVVMHVTGMTFKEVARAIEEKVGTVPYQEPQKPADERRQRERMMQEWQGGQPIAWPDPVDSWLSRRLGAYQLDAVAKASLRYHPGVKLYGGGEILGPFPTMLARVVNRGAAGLDHVQLHRTVLTSDGDKALGGNSRWFIPKLSLPAGSYVPLAYETDEIVGIAEGIETALAAQKLFGVPAHAALNSDLLAKWSPAPSVRHVIVFGDNDESMAGQAAAYTLAKRLIHERDQGKLSCKVEVQIPAEAGFDWNKVLNPRV